MEFKNYSEELSDFLLKCRTGIDSNEYDIIIKGVANDKVFNTVELYLDNLIVKQEALSRLIYTEPNLQICFKTQRSINEYLRFERSEKI